MEEFKDLVLKYFEKILVGIILGAAFVGTYYIEEKFIVLTFYYLALLFRVIFWGRDPQNQILLKKEIWTDLSKGEP